MKPSLTDIGMMVFFKDELGKSHRVIVVCGYDNIVQLMMRALMERRRSQKSRNENLSPNPYVKGEPKWSLFFQGKHYTLEDEFDPNEKRYLVYAGKSHVESQIEGQQRILMSIEEFKKTIQAAAEKAKVKDA